MTELTEETETELDILSEIRDMLSRELNYKQKPVAVNDWEAEAKRGRAEAEVLHREVLTWKSKYYEVLEQLLRLQEVARKPILPPTVYPQPGIVPMQPYKGPYITNGTAGHSLMTEHYEGRGHN